MVILLQRRPYENLLFIYSLGMLQNNQEIAMIPYAYTKQNIYSGMFHKFVNSSGQVQNLLRASIWHKKSFREFQIFQKLSW